MRFLLLLHSDEAAEMALSPEERQAIIEAHAVFAQNTRDRGIGVTGDPLGPSTDATLVKPDGTVTDGPFAETKEQLGGYYVIECADPTQAVAVAREVPASPGLVVEIRPLMDM